MDQYELVRTADRVYKKSIRQIARETATRDGRSGKYWPDRSSGIGERRSPPVL